MNGDQSEISPGARPARVPRLGAAASGGVALLLIGAVSALPVFGVVVAPLGLIPVLSFIAGGQPGYRAWGWPLTLLAIAFVAGLGGPVPTILGAFILVIVCPSLAVEAWVRWRWTEGRWAAVATLAMVVVLMIGVAAVAWPESPLEWIRTTARTSADLILEANREAGRPTGVLEVALDDFEPVIPWIGLWGMVAYLVVVLFWIRPRLPLLGLPVGGGAFEDYRNDEWLTAVFAAFGAGTLLLAAIPRWIALNLLFGVLILFFVQGLAIIRAHLARWVGRGWLVRWGVALLCLQPPLPMLVAALGVADSFHPLRPRANDDGGTR